MATIDEGGLRICIEVQGRSHDFSLEPHKPFVLGRAPESDFQLHDDSVSMRHLELIWDSSVLRVRDLESSNGSFRMPQDSPFMEAQFGAKSHSLELRLATLPLKLSWAQSVEESERTEVLDTSPPAPHAAQLRPSRPSGPETPSKAAASPKPLPEASPAPSKAFHWARPILLSGIFAAVLQNGYFVSQHETYLSVDTTLWKLGSAIDLYLFWLAELPAFVGLWALAFAFVFVLRFYLKPLKSLVLSALFSVLGLALASSVFVWPVVFLNTAGDAGLIRKAITEMQSLQKQMPTHDFSQKEKNIAISSRLNDLSDPLKGSSAFYTFWHNFQKQRVVGECGGLGDEAWDKKRVCLVLLYALSLDAYTSIRPVYLGPTASSLVFLSSLDGVIRVLAAEGPDSENIKVFLATLEGAGLKQEALEFVKLTQSFQGREFSELMSALLDLRLNVERKIFDAQDTAELPKIFGLNLMGPLEMGI